MVERLAKLNWFRLKFEDTVHHWSLARTSKTHTHTHFRVLKRQMNNAQLLFRQLISPGAAIAVRNIDLLDFLFLWHFYKQSACLPATLLLSNVCLSLCSSTLLIFPAKTAWGKTRPWGHFHQISSLGNFLVVDFFCLFFAFFCVCNGGGWKNCIKYKFHFQLSLAHSAPHF